MTDKVKAKERTMVRWLLKMGACGGVRKFRGLTTAQAWKKATPWDRWWVMNSVGMDHNKNCPMCFPDETPKALPKKVLSEFRKFQRTGNVPA